ncbi:MAG: extracellular solute-binding protein [Patescibacteria group bacterium]
MRRFLKPVTFLIVASLFLTTGQGCVGGGGGGQQLEQVTLNYWRVFDDSGDFRDIINAYRALHPNVKINYRKLRYDEYEEELVRAIAEGRGPDIFSMHNTWMNEYQNLMEPMPSSVTIQNQETRGTLRQEMVVVETTKPTPSITTLKNDYVEQVAKDAVLSYKATTRSDAQSRIYGFPLSVDSLALFYNRDLLDAAGIPTPPQNWEEFQAVIPQLTSYDIDGNITQSGAALGTSQNVERSTDILSLLMMQTGTQMTDARGRVAFNTVPEGSPKGFYPGLNALQFYTDYANPTKQVYTWNENYPNSFEAFANGQTAFFFGYSYHIPLLRTAAPRLNFAVASMPQIEGGRDVNYANYWLEVVSNDTKNSNWAWDFLMFASSAENVTSYLDRTDKPTALRNLVNSQLDDGQVAIFAAQTLTAESWYRGSDATAAENALKNLIDDYLKARYEDPADAMELAANRVQQTY